MLIAMMTSHAHTHAHTRGLAVVAVPGTPRLRATVYSFRVTHSTTFLVRPVRLGQFPVHVGKDRTVVCCYSFFFLHTDLNPSHLLVVMLLLRFQFSLCRLRMVCSLLLLAMLMMFPVAHYFTPLCWLGIYFSLLLLVMLVVSCCTLSHSLCVSQKFTVLSCQ